MEDLETPGDITADKRICEGVGSAIVTLTQFREVLNYLYHTLHMGAKMNSLPPQDELIVVPALASAYIFKIMAQG